VRSLRDPRVIGRVACAILLYLVLSTAPATAGMIPLALRYRIRESRTDDRIVFTFRAGAPGWTHAGYLNAVHADASGLPIHLKGSAKFAITFTPATGTETAGATPGPTAAERVASPELALVEQLKPAGDFEGYLSYGIGLRHRSSFGVSRRGDQVTIDFRR
jgi:hypothetical protein